MNSAKTATLRRFATLLVLGSCSAMAGAAEINAAKDATPAGTTTARAALEGAAQDDACRSGTCGEQGSGEQQAEAMAGAELLPKLDLAAILGTEKPEEGC